jgi:hypothetical protein
MIQVKHDDSLVFNKRNQLFPNMQIYNRLTWKFCLIWGNTAIQLGYN